jgi:xanthine dehydrogenase accessory factor
MTNAASIDRLQHAATLEWSRSERRFVAATLVDAEGSAPFELGARMFISDDGQLEGSVTGGCVEAALAQEAEVIFGGGLPVVRTYGISDDEAAGVGLMCGGTVHILLREVTNEARDVLAQVAEARLNMVPAGLALLVDGANAGACMALVGTEVVGTLGETDLLDRSVERDLRGMVDHGQTGLRRYGADGAALGDDVRVFIRSWAPAPSIVIFGAIDFSAAVALLARQLGYDVTVVDAREAFVQSPRFAAAAETVVSWPQEYLATRELGPRDAVLVFTHDPKFDEPALRAALASGAGYVGALGSRRTQEQRVERLRASGVADADIARIAAPCGLDIGARTPAETALSVLSEIVASQAGRSGGPLRESAGPIHATTQHAAA